MSSSPIGLTSSMLKTTSRGPSHVTCAAVARPGELLIAKCASLRKSYPWARLSCFPCAGCAGTLIVFTSSASTDFSDFRLLHHPCRRSWLKTCLSDHRLWLGMAGMAVHQQQPPPEPVDKRQTSRVGPVGSMFCWELSYGPTVW